MSKYILGIETSCDETSASVVKNGREVISNVISTQIPLHQKFGGVVPEIASRKHVELILPVIDEALEKANLTISDIDGIAVTYGPGLVGALLVGISAAKAIAYALNKPLIQVNHIAGHIAANYICFPELIPPYISLVASGGHSHIIMVKDYVAFEILGQTRDDAAGEAFDKIARALNLGYPGGPAIDNLAKNGNKNSIDFPKVFFKDKSLDFSFSGLKTAVLNYINNASQKSEEVNIPDICASFQEAVVHVLITNLISAAKSHNVKHVSLAGGVAANSALRNRLSTEAKKNNLEIYYPSLEYCTDNAAMIASAGYYSFMNNDFTDMYLNAVPNLKISN
jgi:N6-L-threonylcarbamoyladenine synthase